ncbi:ATP synthase F0 subunit B [Candidatus Curtissbacteria bacterium RIFCSPLOWO2_02_FULL_40_11]|uniref:ATP synthase subunit b n=2 Tax=Candidatus Curtissiibacteriota TaxID=1752717 RepID=A0A1F5GBG8_9BACT|nr:MAG: ATP synthase F0 subunit B [Candidatus Curtissbacteria bacterium RIFCSPHIGHO2_01_FULL_39_57]OGD89211.1 MAG: ATP synthase F0 subunit B [Candidatus Curtissbacteria bacterium RIFCSPHIGHO2_02_FULL_40_16b]OGE00887.1 MAG: ATP synthase F0 subunit B [Candidatus Curtissbacteria bacterium RIFCSPLOWO2_02_FULL_40_11]OGE13984.1 MAG: ATP synthase F0 subunit B [Candidatus Curtissbacteria bacterium RIFCSPLOWO2_12_FULL_38_9]
MEILENFGIQPTLLAAQIVNFAIILFLLKKFFYKPILKVLGDRKQRIEESLKNADLIEERLQKTQEQSKKIIEGTQNQAQVLLTDAKKESGRISEKAALDAKKAVEKALADAKDQIEAERQSMQKKLEKDTLELVAAVVKKVLDRNLKSGEKQELTTSAAKQITKQIQ